MLSLTIPSPSAFAVVECKITYFTGIHGIMIRETAEAFGIITEDDKFRGNRDWRCMIKVVIPVSLYEVEVVMSWDPSVFSLFVSNL